MKGFTVNIVRLTPVVAELRALRAQLTRIADVMEADALQQGIISKPVPRGEFRSADPPTVAYTDEAQDFVREQSPAEQAKQREFYRQMMDEDEGEEGAQK